MSVRHIWLDGDTAAERSRQRGCFFLGGREDAQTVDATIGGGDHLDAQAAVIKKYDFARERNAPLDFADQTAERGGFVVFVHVNVLTEKALQLVDREIARAQPRRRRLVLRILDVRILFVLVANVADDLFEQILDCHQPATPPYSSMTMRMCCFSRCISRSKFVAALGLGNKNCRMLNAGDGAGRASSSVICSRSCANAMPVMLSSVRSKTGTREKLCSLQHLKKVLEGDRIANGKHLRTRRHHFAHQLVAELDCGANQVAVALFEDAFFLAGFEQRLDVGCGSSSSATGFSASEATEKKKRMKP